MCASLDCTHSLPWPCVGQFIHICLRWRQSSLFLSDLELGIAYTTCFLQLFFSFSIITVFTVWLVSQKSLGSHDLPLTLQCEISDWGDGPVCCAVWVTGVSLLLCQSNIRRCNVPALSETPNTSQWNDKPTWSRLLLRHLRNRQKIASAKKIEAELVLLLENTELHVVECVV